jgi:HD-GYP domain-containing protein (c-di-GMP phosphodiesterase class II)
MKLHTVKGATMVTTILRDLDRIAVPDPTMLRNVVELHHEKLDGSGYPYGLRGGDVPPEARIVSAADIFDSLTNDRPYKGVWTFDASIAEMLSQVAGGKLDGACVEALAAARAEVERVHAAHQAA